MKIIIIIIIIIIISLIQFIGLRLHNMQRVTTSTLDCGTDCGLAKYKATEGVITSPRYPDLYPKDLKCGYNISTLARFIRSTITIIFDVLDIEFQQNCEYDFILVSYVIAAVSCSDSRSVYHSVSLL